MRLDDRQSAIDVGAIIPGDPAESELIRRITASGEYERMPPEGDPLASAEVDLLRRWVASGAKYERHWAFVAPRPVELPATSRPGRLRNAVNSFVQARLDTENLAAAPAADRYSLIRRVYLDLIGLPPTPAEADEFAASEDPLVYERLVDRLLASPHYGERWARNWLDLARYSDTNGYEKDRPRSIWPFRDWVIRALNGDQPFDRFSIEQLAGDMLPDANVEARIATGFHRNTMLNEEGGIDPLEYRFYAMVDRVATTGTVWLGLTIGCAQCHTHKYDPITHTDYYRFFALLNNADEPDLPLSPDPTAAEKRVRDDIARRQAALPSRFAGGVAAFEASFSEWVDAQQSRTVPWRVLRPHRLESNLPKLELLKDGSIFASGDITKRDVFTLQFDLQPDALPLTALRLEVLPDQRLPAGGPGRAYYEGRKGDFFLSEIIARKDGSRVEFERASHSYGKLVLGSGTAAAANVIDGDGSTGWSTADQMGRTNQLVLNLREPIAQPGAFAVELLFERHFAASLGRFRISAASVEDAEAKAMPAEVERLLCQSPGDWSVRERDRVRRYYRRVAPELESARREIEELEAQLPEATHTLVMQERPADNVRPTHRHHRGEYLSAREPVKPGLPAALVEGAATAPANRLELARWLVSPHNPLVARVTVNRAWQAFFGNGLLSTPGDFGTQAESPSHPRLLDWLANSFVEDGWSLKRLHRRIVLSATYRQAATRTSDLQQRDPRNRLLARGPRLRAPAETVRDMMLAASGLLSRKMYGPSVHPPQAGSVTALAYGGEKWIASTGADRYRRALYTFSKRTAPFAAYTVFDAPTGESCTVRRDRSNTPLQALTLLNDEMYFEMARALAEWACREHPTSREDCARFIFRRLATRPPTSDELAAVVEYQGAQVERLRRGELAVAELTGGEVSPQLAAWMMVARSLMNLDEAVTKP